VHDGKPGGAHAARPPHQYRPSQPNPRPAHRFTGGVGRMSGPRSAPFAAPHRARTEMRAVRPHAVQPRGMRAAPRR
jgi:hypothetical protein